VVKSGALYRREFSAYYGPIFVIAAALSALTAIGLVHPSSLVIAHSIPANVAITSAGVVVALGAAYFALTEYVLSGPVASLYIGIAFLLLADSGAATGLLPQIAGWGGSLKTAETAWAVQRALAAACLVAAANDCVRVDDRHERWSHLIAGVVLITIVAAIFGVWVDLDRTTAPPTAAHTAMQVISAGLFFMASALFWRHGRRVHRVRFVWLAIVLGLGGFSQLEYAAHVYGGSIVQFGDVLRMIFYFGVLLSLLAEWGRGYRVLRSQTRELEVLHALMSAPSIQDPADVVRHATKVIGRALHGNVRIVMPNGNGAPVSDLEDARTRKFGEGPPRHIEAELRVQDRVLGTLVVSRPYLEPFTAHELRLLEAFAAQCSVLLERSLLYEEVAAGAIMEERSRLAREIHDGLAQHLAFLKMRVAWLQRSPTIDSQQLQDIEGVVATALTEARQAISTLRSDVSDASAVEALASYAREFGQVAGIQSVVRIAEGAPDIGPRARAELMRIVQEALNNVRKHAEAHTVMVDMEPWAGGLRVTVADDGRGFVPEAVGDGHFGAEIMHERAAAIGGWLEIHSQPGRGTEIVVWSPAEQSEQLIV